MLSKLFSAFIVVLSPYASAAPATIATQSALDERPQIGLAELTRLDHLARFRTSVRIGAVTSYDRTGGNDDGFSGKYSFVRQENDALVLAELTGPGVIYRIWTPTPTDDLLEFYFDGETHPRFSVPYRQLFDGSRPPFVTPLVGVGSGGFFSYLPIPYRQSCKVVLRAPKTQFYQINFATYPPGTNLATFDPQASELNGPTLARAQAVLGLAGQNVSEWVVPEGTPLETARATRTIAPGASTTVFETQTGGRIAGLRLRSASAFAGKDRGVVLRIYWDDGRHPAVHVPAGDFFGYSWGQPAARSLLTGTNGDTCYAYFPMPFDRSARIELLNERADGAPIEVHAEVVHAALPRRADEGRFYALWRRENPTTAGQPFTILKVEGRGHLVGAAVQAQGEKPGDTWFFEGDDQATIDGELVVHGTGSEDFFNGGWYDVPGRWERRASYPLSGCLDYFRPQSRTGGYRLFIGDAYSFARSLELTIEHGPDRNELVTDHVGVSYLYLERPPAAAWALPSVAHRTVDDPKLLVYTPGWNPPGLTFSIQNATVTRKLEKIGDAEHRSLSLRAHGSDVFSPHHLAFFCEVPAAGRYRVSIERMLGPDEGTVQLVDSERVIGEAHEGRASKRAKSDPIPMGVLDLPEGLGRVFFRVTGSSEQPFGFDLVTLTLERVDDAAVR
jgi:hypothetical protein